MCSGSRPNRWWASISSSPLFIMVAESTEIFAPITQLGCAMAWRGVTSAISTSERVRNGPPEAVRISRSTLSPRSPRNAWKIALCSESTGSSTAPLACTSSSRSLPAQTSDSLVARATMAPRRTAASVGPSPAAPTIADITHSAERSAASFSPSGPEAASIPDPASASLRGRYAAGSATTARRARCRRAAAASRSAWL